jgi:hypothetical protein
MISQTRCYDALVTHTNSCWKKIRSQGKGAFGNPFYILIYFGNWQSVDKLVPSTLRSHSFFDLLFAQLCRGLLSYHHKVIPHKCRSQFDAVLISHRFIVNLQNFHHERILDAEYRIGRFVRIVLHIQRSVSWFQYSIAFHEAILGVHLRDQRIVAVLLEHEVHVAWSVRVALKSLKELANWTVMWNWIRHRLDSVEPEGARIVTSQDCSTIRTVAICVLHIVETLRISFPNIDFRSADGVALDVFDGTEHKQRLSIRVSGDMAAVIGVFGLVCMEGSKNCAVGSILWLGMIDRIDQQRKAQDVGE